MSIIEMRDVVKNTTTEQQPLRGVTVKVEPGEFAYIVGPSGREINFYSLALP